MKFRLGEHPDLDQIKRFVRGEASPAENRELVRHLLHGCPECQKVVREYWSEEDGAAAQTESTGKARGGLSASVVGASARG